MTDKRSIPIDDQDGMPSAAGAEDPSDTGSEEVAADLALLAAERDTYFDSLLRLKAEFDNYRKRTQRELLEADTRVRTSVLAEFLPVLDNLERALNAAEHHEEGKVLAGVRSRSTSSRIFFAEKAWSSWTRWTHHSIPSCTRQCWRILRTRKRASSLRYSSVGT